MRKEGKCYYAVKGQQVLIVLAPRGHLHNADVLNIVSISGPKSKYPCCIWIQVTSGVSDVFRHWNIKAESMCETKLTCSWVMLFIKQFALNSEGCAIFNLWDQNCGIWSLKQDSTVHNHRMSSSSWQLPCTPIIGEQPHCFQSGEASGVYWVHAHLYTK